MKRFAYLLAAYVVISAILSGIACLALGYIDFGNAFAAFWPIFLIVFLTLITALPFIPTKSFMGKGKKSD